MTPKEKELLKHFRALTAADAETLLAFAEFLSARSSVQAAIPTTPIDIPRPESETVVAAIRRLTATYPMLDKNVLLHETSSLMAAHVMQGRPAPDVIDEMEQLFQRHFSKHTGKDDNNV